MSLASNVLDEAKRIAAEFAYPAEHVRRDVAEFMSEMEKGLAKEDTTLSQIPTFITSVPDGSEKVAPSPSKLSLGFFFFFFALFPN